MQTTPRARAHAVRRHTVRDLATLGLDPRPARERRLDAMLWIGQAILALAFGIAGGAVLALPVDDLGRLVPWAHDLPEPMLALIGAAELFGALGVVVPALIRMRPRLTSIAALGLFAIAMLAIAFHLWRGEPSRIPLAATLAAIALLVAWGRWRKLPITSGPPQVVVD